MDFKTLTTLVDTKAEKVIVTTTVDGLMSKNDKIKLDDLVQRDENGELGGSSFDIPEIVLEGGSKRYAVTATCLGEIETTETTKNKTHNSLVIKDETNQLWSIGCDANGHMTASKLSSGTSESHYIQTRPPFALIFKLSIASSGHLITAPIADMTLIDDDILSGTKGWSSLKIQSTIDTKIDETQESIMTHVNGVKNSIENINGTMSTVQKHRVSADNGTSLMISGTDLNELTTCGSYNGSGLTNAPTTTEGDWYYVEVQAHTNNNGYFHQRATRLNTVDSFSKPIVWERICMGNEWKEWRQVTPITISTGNPSGGKHGDIWLKYK